MDEYQNHAQNHKHETTIVNMNEKEKERFTLLPIVGMICFLVGLVRIIIVFIDARTITTQSSFLIVIGSILLIIHSESSQKKDAIDTLKNENDRLRRDIKYVHELIEKK